MAHTISLRLMSPRLSRLVYLWQTLVAQELRVRYRGTVLGAAWQFLSPLFLLAIYGFVFGIVFGARWPGFDPSDRLMFAINLFLGLSIHAVLAETWGAAPTVMQRNSNFVRKVVFPLEVLVAVPLGVALVNALSALLIVCLVASALDVAWSASGLWHVIPIFSALGALALGVALWLAALGVYVRDLGQVMGMMVTAILFTSPVFYPLEMAPEVLRDVILFNPLTVPVEHVRDALIMGQTPNWQAFAIYAGTAVTILASGLLAFRVLRRGFADAI